MHSAQVLANGGKAGGHPAAELAGPLSRTRGGRGNMLVLEVGVHSNVPLKSFMTGRAHKRQWLVGGSPVRLPQFDGGLNLDGFTRRLLAELIYEGGVEGGLGA